MGIFSKREDGSSFLGDIGGLTDKVGGLMDKVEGFKLPTIKTQNTVALDRSTMGVIAAALVLLYLIFKRK